MLLRATCLDTVHCSLAGSSRVTTSKNGRFRPARPHTLVPSKQIRISQRHERLPAIRALAEEVTPTDIPFVSAQQAKGLLDRGYVFLDIRTPDEHAEGSKRFFENLPIAAWTQDGPVINSKWAAAFNYKFPNKISRVLILCDDGTDRSEIAADVISKMGYTSVKIVEGGVAAYLEVDPLDAKDTKPKWKLTGNQTGVRYSYGDGELDDGA